MLGCNLPFPLLNLTESRKGRMTGHVGKECDFYCHVRISVHKFNQSNICLKVRPAACSGHYHLILAGVHMRRGGGGWGSLLTQSEKSEYFFLVNPPPPTHTHFTYSRI